MGAFKTSFLKKIIFSTIIISFCTIPAATQNKADQAVNSATLQWTMQAGPLSNLKILAPNKELFLIDGLLHLAVIEKGKIEVYQYGVDLQWAKVQTLEVPEVSFTTMFVKDLNNDRIPEIVAGTTDPGFIFVYRHDREKQWVATHDPKYIWSTIVKMTAARFLGNPTLQLVAQNKEGFLFVFKPSETALDLIWKSPTAWKPLERIVAVDLDNDANDELLAVYKNGGIAVLKTVKNAITSVWENYPWGKVLTINYNDWDNNNQAELILSTTRKMVCLINPKNKSYYAKQIAFDYVIEKGFFIKVQNRKILLTADTSGKIHILKSVPRLKQTWKETQSFQTGRVLEIFENGPNQIMVVNQMLQVITITFFPLR
jgi:hypothetical protein